MSNVRTLKDINKRGYRLGSAYEQELEKKLRTVIDFNSEIINFNEKLQVENSEYSEREKESQRTYADIGNKISQLNVSTTKVRSQLISERKSHSESQRELEAKYSAEIKSLKSNIKTLKREATLAQKALSVDKFQILSFEIKIHELESKLKDIDLERTYHDLDVMGRAVEEPTQISSSDPKEIDSLKLELERANEDFNSKKYIMKKGIEASDNIYKWELDSLSSARLNLLEKNAHLQELLSKKDNEVDTPPPPMNDSSQPSTLNPSSQIISVGGAEAYLLRLYGSWPGNGGIRGKKKTDISLMKNMKIGQE
ncbi:hypothetical protein C1645_839200 [Glomus cerebriforme]|uniref:Uncharacterized protein n=1 Tax=Glomus cerebriforme TaxID=658196 RepID=A0A397S119_9GLOM|nr:hypothetical protein C1645_839200 [Glomus cerebriforme]